MNPDHRVVLPPKLAKSRTFADLKITPLKDVSEYGTQENIKIPKTMYLIIFQSGEFLNHKINTICDSFMGEKFDLPSMDKCSEEINDISIKIDHAKDTVSRITKEMKNYFKMDVMDKKAWQDIADEASQHISSKRAALNTDGFVASAAGDLPVIKRRRKKSIMALPAPEAIQMGVITFS